LSRQYRARGWRIENTRAECQKLVQLAQAGVLRSYFLRCGDEACAYVKGFQYNDIYYYNQTGFDERFAQFSPGTVLLYLLLEDLFQHRRPGRVNLYPGEWSYKELFATQCPTEMRVLVLRRTLAHRLQIACHAGFRRSIGVAKQWLGGPPA
jgi:CelD/BcsL family acetyltransferase involved in cellulose biosynthesis